MRARLAPNALRNAPHAATHQTALAIQSAKATSISTAPAAPNGDWSSGRGCGQGALADVAAAELDALACKASKIRSMNPGSLSWNAEPRIRAPAQKPSQAPL